MVIFIVIAVFIANDTIIAHTACPPPWGRGTAAGGGGGLAMTMMFTIAITAPRFIANFVFRVSRQYFHG